MASRDNVDRRHFLKGAAASAAALVATGMPVSGAQDPGRGVYTCRRLQCFERAAANRGFARTCPHLLRAC